MIILQQKVMGAKSADTIVVMHINMYNLCIYLFTYLLILILIYFCVNLTLGTIKQKKR